jgi:hypothetical protein
VHAEKLVPFKMDVPSVCGFPDVQLPEDTVVFGAGGDGGKLLIFK